jgi:hypothetical protein
MSMNNSSSFHILPCINTKIAYKLNNTYEIYASLGYIHSFNSSVSLYYEVTENNVKVYTGSGYLSGKNINYGIGISFNPKVMNK